MGRQRSSPTTPRPTGFSPRNTASRGHCRKFDYRRVGETHHDLTIFKNLDFTHPAGDCEMSRFRALLIGAAGLFLTLTTARAGEPKWKQHAINGRSEFEAAGVFDVDNDGKL